MVSPSTELEERRCFMNNSMLIWIITFLVEVLLLSSGILGYLLWRARRTQARLRVELEQLRSTRYSPATEQPIPEPLSDNMRRLEEEKSNTLDHDITKNLQSSPKMEQSFEQLQEKNEFLVKWLDTLEMHVMESGMTEQKILTLQRMLQDARGELATLRQINIHLQQHQHEKDILLRKSADELRASARQRAIHQATIKELQATNAGLMAQNTELKEKVLAELKTKMSASSPPVNDDHEQQALKQEIHRLQTKLTEQETAYHQLQKDYNTLSIEYQRLFDSFQQS